MGMWVQALVAPLVALLVLWRGLRRPADREARRWAERFRVDLDNHVELVRARLGRGRRVRAMFVAAGVVVAGLPPYANLIDPHRSASFANPLVGNAWLYSAALGALVAEIFVVQRPTRHEAALQARRVGDYVDLRFARAIYASVPLATAAAVVATALEWWRWWYGWVGVAGTIIATLTATVGLRGLVNRPALVPAGTLRGIDDALRADGAFRLVGSGFALAAASVAVTLPQEASRGWWGLITIAGSLLSLFGLAMWWTLARDARWSVAAARAAS